MFINRKVEINPKWLEIKATFMLKLRAIVYLEIQFSPSFFQSLNLTIVNVKSENCCKFDPWEKQNLVVTFTFELKSLTLLTS